MKFKILGVTGPIGCGKSTVSKMTVECGAIEHIDADRVTHQLMHAGTKVTRRIVGEFGYSTQAEDGSVNRKELAGIVFANAEALRRLESIVHPAVREAIAARIGALRLENRYGVVTVEAIRLLEGPVAKLCDEIWVVTCRRETQLARLTADRNMVPNDARRRIAAQPSFASDLITQVIENDGGRDELAQLVDGLWHAVTS